MNRKISILILTMILSLILYSNIAFAATHQYATANVTNNGHRGIMGDFKLPYINAGWSTTYPNNFITFEQWLRVNNTSDWFEIGYMDGSMRANQGPVEYYTGFFKAKSINETYVEDKLIKTATVGTRYTFEIVDFNANNLWEIYIGSTYFGSFTDRVPSVSYGTSNQGYEKYVDGSSVLSVTDITNQYYRSQGVWNKWSTGTVVTSNSISGFTASYNSSTNTTTIN